MYYDLIASLPPLPYFERATGLPLSRLRLDQRLRLLKPRHADQLAPAQAMADWYPEGLFSKSDAALVADYNAFIEMPLTQRLRDYVAFRMNQRTLLLALRRKAQGQGAPDRSELWGAGTWSHHIFKHWDEVDFGLTRLYPWIPAAQNLLTVGDAKGLERLLMQLAWRWLEQCALHDMFSFEAVFSYYFRWDILQTWLAYDPIQGQSTFRELVDKVTRVECN